MTALVIFVLSYIGIALGKVPGLVMDRTGIALLGAIAMVVFGVSKVILRHADLSTTQGYLGKVSDSEAIRWIETLYG